MYLSFMLPCFHPFLLQEVFLSVRDDHIVEAVGMVRVLAPVTFLAKEWNGARFAFAAPGSVERALNRHRDKIMIARRNNVN